MIGINVVGGVSRAVVLLLEGCGVDSRPRKRPKVEVLYRH